MNPLAWAKRTALSFREKQTKTEEVARYLRDRFPQEMWSDDGFQFWIFNTLARDVMRSWKRPGVRTHSVTRIYKPRKELQEEDWRDILSSCKEDMAKYFNKGCSTLRQAIAQGYEQLRFEFPEFDVEED